MAVSLTPKSAIKPVVIGYGSPLRQDDAMGLRAVELLEQALPPDAAVVIQEHQLTPELAETLQDRPLVIFIDAAANLSPGTIRLESLRPAENQAWSHHILPEQLLLLAKQVNGSAPPAFLISGGIEEAGLSQTLTETGQACAQGMADLAGRILKKTLS